MRLGHETDAGIGHRARLGLIVLQADETIEPEFRRWIDLDGVALYCARVPSGRDVTAASLSAMASHIPEAARLLPEAAPPDVIAYACTSGAATIGSDEVARSIRAARAVEHPGHFGNCAITDPLQAFVAACRALDVRRPALVSPYIAEVADTTRAALERAGLSTVAGGSFELAEEGCVARIIPSSVHDAIVRVAQGTDCDAVLVSCTNMRTWEVLAAAEEATGMPVISSNQALAWHMLRCAGIADPLPGRGALFSA